MANSEQQSVESLCQSMWAAYSEGDLTRAIGAGEKAWALATTTSGMSELQMSEISHNLGELYRLAGRFDLADAACRRAIRIREKLLGPAHPLLGNSLETLAKIQDQTEDLDAAENTYARVISIRRANRGAAEPQLAETLADYAALLLRRENLEACSASFREAREIFERLGNTDTWYYCALLTNEASASKRAGNWDEAERLNLQALAIYRKIHGDNDSRSASVLVNLAELYREQGKLADSERVHQILDRIERQAGHVTFELRQRRGNRGLLRADQGRYQEAFEDLLKAAAFDDHWLGDVFTFASQKQMLNQMRSVIGHAYALLSLLLQRFADQPDATRFAHTLILRRKAIVQDSLAAARRSSEAGAAKLSLSLETVDGESVANALPDGTALVEYFKYAPYRFGSYPAKGEERWGAPKYLALVIRRDTDLIPPLDLGEASEIDEIVMGFRRTVTDARDFAASSEHETSLAERDEANKALRRRVFEPLAEALKGINRLYVAPDSELSLAPFEILLMDNERYLIDNFTISYLSSGRDVLGSREAVPQAAASPLVMAHPNYDLSRDGPSGRGGAQPRSSRPGAPSVGPFGPLKETREEGIKIGAMLGVEPLLDNDAVEGALKHVHGPRVLHIATHGFFLPSRSDPRERAEEPSPDRDAMRRSGLALAGANTFWKGGDLPEDAGDGVLYAEDVTILDLVGTQLVVLSACDTARGEVRAGEGIFGLRRAFVLAGARTLVMSSMEGP